MELVTVASPQLETSKRKLVVADCDIHPAPKSLQALDPYLPAYWQEYRETYGVRLFGKGPTPRNVPHACRVDAWPPEGGPPGSSLALMREQLLDRWEIAFGVLNATVMVARYMNLDFATAQARALNDWMVAEWLDPEPRLRASIELAYEDPQAAAAELRRCARDARFVQAQILTRTMEPLGRRKYWPIYDAAAECGLPIGIHFGTTQSAHPTTSVGFPAYYLEDHAGMAASFQEQVTSLVFEGVFTKFPALKVIIIEGGAAWMPPLMWRMDLAWQAHRKELPHVPRPPSEIVREHFWITSQPMEEPPRDEHFLAFLDDLDMNDRLMFSSDYPHWDFDQPDRSFPNSLDAGRRAKFMAANAMLLYGFDG
jgi:predicted TIM-barrel fold metal-dependent hydrolase